MNLMCSRTALKGSCSVSSVQNIYNMPYGTKIPLFFCSTTASIRTNRFNSGKHQKKGPFYIFTYLPVFLVFSTLEGR